MQKLKVHLLSIALFSIGTASPGLAQNEPADPNATAPKSEPAAPKKKSKPAAEAKGHSMPFHGKLGAVDKVEKTLTIKGKEKDRTIQITSHTKLSKDGKPSTLADAVVGEDISGFAKETTAGKYEALSIRLDAKPPGHSKSKKTTGEPKPDQKPQ